MFKFSNGSLGLTNEEITAAESKKGGRFLSPGIHEVKIVEADFHYKDGSCMNKNDPTWATVKVVYENAAKAQIQNYLLIPTTKLLFNEGVSKKPEFVFLQFKAFCASIGVEVSADAKVLTQVMTKYFKDPKKLIGLTSEIEVGYSKPYVKYLDKDQYQLCKASGELLVDEVFPTKEAALLKGMEVLPKVTFEEFARVVKFIGKLAEKPVEKPKKAVDVPNVIDDEDF